MYRMSQQAMKSFSLKNYDVLGFDLDHTLARYKLQNLYKLCYTSIVSHLVEIGYPEKIFREYDSNQLKFCQKGLIYDLERGNMLKLDAKKEIRIAFHGTRRLTPQQVETQYRGSDTMQYLQEMPFVRGKTGDHITKVLHCFTDYFTVGTIYLLMEIVDAIENGQIKIKDFAKPYYDMFEGYSQMYRREAFREHSGYFFPLIKDDPSKMLFKLPKNVLDWLKQLRSTGMKTIIITSSNVDFAEALLGFCVGPDWLQYFDSVITFARKPGFWTDQDRPFFKIDSHKEGEMTVLLKPKVIYAQGNYDAYKVFLQEITGKDDPRMLYVGDSLTDDMYVPTMEYRCETVGIVEEIENDDSTEWESFFRAGDCSSLWNKVISESTSLAVPSVEKLSELSPEQVLVRNTTHHWITPNINEKYI